MSPYPPAPARAIPALPVHKTVLRDGTAATIYPVASASALSPSLLAFLARTFNDELERGQTYPLEGPVDDDAFVAYWFAAFAAVILAGDVELSDERNDWETVCLGSFYVKPNYPGRCDHICNAGFLTTFGSRGRGVGRALAKIYLQWAPQLGYTYSVFNLVFVTNVASLHIWDSLGFDRIGLVPRAGRLKGYAEKVDAVMFGKDLV